MYLEPCLETGDELVTCPYDPSHRLRPTRYHLHLKKCAVQHPEKQYHICNLNFTHHVPPEKIKVGKLLSLFYYFS